LGKSFCLRSKLGNPGKHHDRSVFEAEVQKPNKFSPKNHDRELLLVLERDFLHGHLVALGRAAD